MYITKDLREEQQKRKQEQTNRKKGKVKDVSTKRFCDASFRTAFCVFALEMLMLMLIIIII